VRRRFVIPIFLLLASVAFAQPTISTLAVTYNQNATATITWTTSTPATTQLLYGVGVAPNQKTNAVATLATAHSITLSGLSSAYVYNYQAISTDGGGNTTTSAVQSFESCSGTGYTVVSGTLNNYYEYGTYALTLTNPSGSSVTPSVCGVPIPTTFSGTLTGGPSFSTNIPDNLKMVPSPSQWSVTVTGIDGSIGSSTNPITIAGTSMDISTILQAATSNDLIHVWFSPSMGIFYPPFTGGAATWGAIGGVIGDQIDLQSALNAKMGNTASAVAAAIQTQTGCTTAGYVWVPQSNTCVAQSGSSFNPASPGNIGTTTPGQVYATNLAAQSALFQSGPERCIEYFLTFAMAGDYGQAINAANAFASLTTPSTMKACVFGDHTISTPAVINRPIVLKMHGSRLIPQAALGSTPVGITNATVTAGSTTIAVSSTSGLLVNQAVGGLGITSGSYISAIGSGTITLSLMPSLIVNGFVTSGSNQFTNTSSLAGVAVGQGVAGYGIPGSTTISSINYAMQILTLSNTANATSFCPPGSGATVACPSSISISSGTWTVPTLTAAKVTPVLTFAYNPAALQNEYNQNIHMGMSGVWIDDTSVRGIQGLQGVQIYGQDHFVSYDLLIDDINGSGLVISGNSPDSAFPHGIVRESAFFNTRIQNSGSNTTAQPSIAVISSTCRNNSACDEVNQVGFTQGEIATGFGESLTVGTYNSSHINFTGPRSIFFNENFQIEGGQYQTGYSRTHAQFDLVHIIQGDDIYLNGAELNGGGYGKAVVRVDQGNVLSISNTRIQSGAITQTYTVSLTNGSKNVTLISSSDGNGFVTDGTWNGIGALAVDGTACVTIAPCSVYLDPSNGVPSASTLLLATAYPGITNLTTATLQMPVAGYIINMTGALGWLNTSNSVMEVSTNQLLGITSSPRAFYVGSGYQASVPKGMQLTYTGMNIPVLTANSVTSNTLNTSGKVTASNIGNYGFQLTPSSDSYQVELYGTNAAGSTVPWQISNTGISNWSIVQIGGQTVLNSNLTGYHGNASGTKVQLSDNTGTSQPAFFDANGNLSATAAYRKLLANCGTLSATAAVSDSLTCAWVTSSSACTVTPISATTPVWTYASPGTGSVTVYHVATAITNAYSIACSAN
jgi:hypothetical protein